MKKLLLNFLLMIVVATSGAQIIVSGEVTTNTTWTNNNIYIISGWLYVRDGATLTIQPGTVVKGDFASQGALIIERGAMLIADGTAEQPIVFTSQKAAGERFYGDWGGIILCGKASINSPENVGNGTVAGENIIEGGVGSRYGGGANPDDDDNSGILRYVRIEFGGIAFQPNSEINGLTCGGVGRGTTIDHVQVSYSGDDAFEFFGGTVNCTNLIAYRTWDDDFDTDFGYRGKIQWAMSYRDPAIADQSGSNGFESDNDGQGTANTPITSPVFSNVTIIGPYVTDSNINSNYKRALHLRRNTKTSVFNSVFVGYPVGLLIDGATTQTNATNNELRFKNSALVAMTDSLATTTNANPNNISGSFNMDSWFNNGGNANSLITGANELLIHNLSLTNPDLTLAAGSPLLSGADFSDNYLNGFFTPTTYRGAFGTENWTKCWAEWDPQTAAYNGMLNNTVSANISINGSATVCEGESISLTAESDATGASYAWSNGESSSSIVVSAPADIALVVTNSDGCSSEPASVQLNTYPTPSVAISADGPTSFCTGGSVVLTSSQSAGNLWSQNGTSQSITVTTSGTYSLDFTDNNGCQASSNVIVVSVSDSPVPTITTNGSTEICEGQSVVLTSSESDSYEWQLNGNTLSNAISQTLTVTEEGAYTVQVTNADQCDGTGTSQFIFIQVNPTPDALFDYDAEFGSFDYEFNNNSTNATSYNWDFGDGSTSNEVNPSHTFTTPGSHIITLTATNGNCEDVFTITISDVAVEENQYASEISLYPNPTMGNASLRVEMKNTNDIFVTVHDLTGKTVYTTTEKNAFGQQTINLPSSDFGAGIYFINIEISQSSHMLRLIVKN